MCAWEYALDLEFELAISCILQHTNNSALVSASLFTLLMLFLLYIYIYISYQIMIYSKVEICTHTILNQNRGTKPQPLVLKIKLK